MRATAYLMSATLLCACGSEDPIEPPAACQDEMPPEVLLQSRDVRYQGFVRVTDVRDLAPNEDGSARDIRTGRVQSGFADFSAATSTQAQLLLLGSVCVGVTSRSSNAGQVRVSAGDITVTVNEPLTLTETSTGIYVRTGMPLLDGGFRLQMTASGATFPAFDEMVDAPMAFEGVSFVPEEVDPAGMELTWTPGDGDWVRLTLAPPAGSTATGGQVVCQVRDDGCFTVPASAASFVLSNNELEYRVTLERTRYRAVDVDGESFVELEVTQREERVLPSGVFE